MKVQNNDSDLVEILVPRHLVVGVYQFISSQSHLGASLVNPRSAQDSTALPEDWSASLIRRMYTESQKNMRAILDLLANRAGEIVRADELIDALSKSRGDNATSSTLGGTLGAFGRRVKNRYGQESWPFEAHWDSDASQVLYRMSPAVAELITDE